LSKAIPAIRQQCPLSTSRAAISKAIFLVAVVLLVLCQDIVGVVFAGLFGLDPLLGLCTGSISMIGGHATSSAFGPQFEMAGITGATTVAIASATFGLIMGGVMGNVVARKLIIKHKIVTPSEKVGASEMFNKDEEKTHLDVEMLVLALGWLFIAAGLGTIVSGWIGNIMIFGKHLIMPSYIGSMLVAALIRNIFDFMKKPFHVEESNVVGSVSLSFFLALALMSLKLWELLELAGPMLALLIAQTVLIAIFTYFVIFNIMGRNYDAVVFSSACCGFGMGATANAMANMDALTTRYGFTEVPYFVVPIVGSLFIDFINSGIITIFTNIFG
ncbi:MAG: sodium/glutamate symporter, partial [Oscillospiraceae bacterium]